MKKSFYSPIYVFMKMVLFLNILLLVIGASFLLTQNDYLLDIIPNPDYRQMIFSLNRSVIIMGGFITALNLILLILTSFYSQQKYFRLLDKIDFENIQTSVSLLKNLKGIDEVGHMGKKLKDTLSVYLRFSFLKKMRIELEQQKFHFIMNRIEDPALHLIYEEEQGSFRIKFANTAALQLLNLEKRSIILGRPFDFILDRESSEEFFNILSALDYEKNREISEKPLEASLKVLMNLGQTTEPGKKVEKSKDPVYEEFPLDFYPFFLAMPHDLAQKSEGEDNDSMVLDSFLVIFKQKKGFWKK